MRQIIMVLVLFLCSTVSAVAASTVACHCFQERQYQPQNSHAADPYFLATTQNSLMAILFGVDKKSLVRAKMSGADGNYLWVSHYLAQKSGLSVPEIDQAFLVKKSWQDVVTRLSISTEQQGPNLSALLDSSARSAVFIVDDALVSAFQLSPDVLNKLRKQEEVANKEVILSVFLGQVSGINPEVVYDRFKAGVSWGKLLHGQGLFDGAGIERKWHELISR